MAVKVHDTQDVERTLPEVAEVGEYARSKVAEEKSRALAAEGELEDQITAEKTRAEAAESTLTENLSKEISDRQAAVEDEAEARASADSSLSQSIQEEAQRAEGAEQALQTAVNAKLERVGGTTTNPQVYAKSASGSQQMVDYGTGLVGNGLVQRDANGQVVVPTPTVTTHAVNKQYVDQKVANIDSTTSGLQEAIDAEKTRAMQAESGLQDAIDAEESARASAISTLTERVAAEETARQQGDSANNTKIESETTRAQQAEGALQEAIDAEESRAMQVENGLSSRLTNVEGKIPAQASAQNQLADKNYVTDLVSKSAADRVTYNQAGDPFPTRNALLTASTFYHAGAVYTPNEHDYALVVADEGAPSPFTGGQTRFEWNGSTWEYAYGINERPFTSEEQAALDSGITAEKVAKIDQKLDKSSTASSLYGTDTSGSQVMVPRSSFATSAQGAKADTAYQKPAGGIPKADLDSTVQSSLNKADSAYQKPTGGITESDLSSSVNQSLDKADSSYQKPVSGIPKSDLASDVQESLDSADSAYHKPEGGITESDLSSSVNVSLDKADTAYQKPSVGIPKSDLDTAVQEVLTTAEGEPALRQAADTALGGRIDDILDGTTPPQKVVGSYEQLEDGTYNLIIGLTGDAPSAAAITQINGEDLAGKEFYDYVHTVGAVIFSFNDSFSPSALWGGSWSRVTNRFLIGSGGTYSTGVTGGEASHGHEAEGYTRFIANPNDRMSVVIVKRQGAHNWAATYTNDNTGWYSVSNWTYDGYIPTDVDVDSANNMPPYIGCNIWRKIA